MMEKERIRQEVRKAYGAAVKSNTSCCGSRPASESSSLENAASRIMGYTPEQLAAVPEDSVLGLGCGNPTALASLQQGETVLDLGAGAGIDCFLAAKAVGETGRVVGVDMTAEMVDRARENVRKNHYANVEFRLGEIENLPVADRSVDVILSNCVINLSPEKPRVFAEAYRVLKPGGRLMISDIVLLKDLPAFIRESTESYVECIAGASRKEEYLAMIRDAGFGQIEVVSERPVSMERPEASNCQCGSPERKPSQPQTVEQLAEFERFAQSGTAEIFATSIQVRAIKPVSGEQ
jgi:arsenite methyltransferase